MFSSRISLCVVGGLLLAFGPALFAGEKLDLTRLDPVPASEPIPVMDFFRPRLLQNPHLNSTGTHIAAIVTAGEDQHELFVVELKTQKGERLRGSMDRDIYGLHWLNDKKLLFELSARKMYGVGLFATDVGRISGAYPLFQYSGSELIAVPRADRLHPLVWNRYDQLDPGVHHDLGVCAAAADAHIGAAVNLLAAGANMSDVTDVREFNSRHVARSYPQPRGVAVRYLADRDGQLAFCVTAAAGVQTLERLQDGEWRNCPVNLDHINIVTCGDAAGQLLVVGPRQKGKTRALQLMDAATGKLGEVVLQDTEYDFNGRLYRHPVTGEMLGAVVERNGPRVFWFSPQYGVFQQQLDALFPGVVVRILGSDDAQKIFLVATFSDRQPAIYHWVDLEKRTAGLFNKSAPWIEPKRMQPVNILKFKTRDGHKLDGYLTLPAGTSKQNPAPLVVLPHGGPWVRDSWGFDGEAQFLASRGYAVLKPNYRGSTGYDWMFPEGDRFDFLKMQDDVTDATKAVILTGLVDPRRIAIMGGSFGGYLAVNGVEREPTLYRCAVSNAGVFDWAELIREKDDYRTDSTVSDWLIRNLGDPKKQEEKFEAISPLRHVDQIRVPVFVAGGKDDPNVEITQSKRLISALEKYHVPRETYLVGGEGHGMLHLNHQVELYTRIVAFLDKYLKPVTPIAAVP